MHPIRFPLLWLLISIFLIVTAVVYFLVGFQYIAEITRDRDGDGVEYLGSVAAVVMTAIGFLSLTTLGIRQLGRRRS